MREREREKERERETEKESICPYYVGTKDSFKQTILYTF
jgi:hypothetical protein